MKSIVFIILTVTLLSCKGLFQYNPNEIRLEEYEQDLNAKNIARLSSYQPSDTLKFVLIGDSQRFYDEVEILVQKLNEREKDAAFVLLAGDITDFGLSKEFKWINDRLRKLHIPYITVIGNHDMLGNGGEVYSRMFGPMNFSFNVGQNKFICMNTNALESGYDGSVPDLPWLSNELNSISHQGQGFVVSHIPPFDPGFDSTKEENFAAVLAESKKVKLSMHGHQHQFSVSKPYNDGVTYLVSASMNKRTYTLVTVWGDQFKIQEKFF
jgi:3',5'-cyclic-AMP phosphodiesterase